MTRLDNTDPDSYARVEDLLRGRGDAWMDVDEILGDEDVALLQVELDQVLSRRFDRRPRRAPSSTPSVATESRRVARAA